jgi:integrase
VHVTSYRIWSFSDEIRFLSSIEDDGDRFLFTLLVYYGLRIGEALALKWSDFRKNGLSISRAVCCKSGKGAVEFLTPKTKNSVRVLPILDVVKPFLDMAHSSVYCFPAREKGAVVLGETSVRRLNIRYADSCGLAPLKLHEFRHSCASNLLSQGLPLRVVARWLGDTEATVSSTYSHLLPDEKSLIKDYFDSQNGGKKVVKNKKKS